MNDPETSNDAVHWMVLVTAPDRESATTLTTAALTKRLVACANIIPQVESHYWWNGQIESSHELLIIFKSTTPMLDPLKELILSLHPYDVPEFIGLNITTGNRPYLDWISNECSGLNSPSPKPHD